MNTPLLQLLFEENAWKVQKSAIYKDKTQAGNFQANPLYQATKRHSNNS